MSLVEELKQVLFRPRRTLHQFIAINVFVFFAIKLIAVFELLFRLESTLSSKIVFYLSVPASLDALIKQPWSLFTYMFLHEGFFHLLFNMLGLYWFGQLLEEYIGGKKFAWIYIFGGLTGALLFILMYNVFPAFENSLLASRTLGASAGVLAIAVATATLLPNYQFMLFFFGLVKIKYIVLFYVLLDVINIAGDNAGGHIAHLGGAILGFCYIRQLRSGNDISSPFSNFGKKLSSLFKKKSKMKVAYKNTENERRNIKKQPSKQEIIDRILDKISKTGYEGLTKEEKEILFKASQEKE